MGDAGVGDSRVGDTRVGDTRLGDGFWGGGAMEGCPGVALTLLVPQDGQLVLGAPGGYYFMGESRHPGPHFGWAQWGHPARDTL